MAPEKTIYAVLKTIDNQRRITPKGHNVIVNQNKFSELGLNLDDVASAIAFLQKNDRSIEIVRWPHKHSSPIPKAMRTVITIFKQQDFDTDSYHLRTLPKFPASVSFYEKKAGTEIESNNALSKIAEEAGQFTVREDGTIAYKGNLIPLQPKHQKIAALLIASYPNVVPNEKLIDTYWEDKIESDASYLDSKSQADLMTNIHDATSQLRKTFKLCDQKTHIENVHSTGYKFLV